MKYAFYFISLFVVSSCNYFETEKITSETFYTQEIETINFKDVDTYPVFENCQNISEKEASKQCFINALSAIVSETILNKHLVAVADLNETIVIAFQVSEKGTIAIQHFQIDSLATLEFPKLTTWISQRIDSITLVAPAYKRGIPVTTQFTLPIKLSTEER